MNFSPNENVLRVALIIFCIIFGILSIALLALGVVYMDELWWPKRYVGLDFMKLPTMLITLGTLSLIMAIAGCLCAKTYNRKLLLLFGFVLLAILCLELTIAVIAFTNFDEHEGSDTPTHRLMMKQFNSAKEEDLVIFREIEDHYNCCGVFGNETNCTIKPIEYYNDLILDNSDNSTDYCENIGCARVVDKNIQLIASEIGYISLVLGLLQIVEIGYVYLIQRLIQ